MHDIVLQLWSSTGLGSKYLSRYVVKLLYGYVYHLQRYNKSKSLKKPFLDIMIEYRKWCVINFSDKFIV